MVKRCLAAEPGLYRYVRLTVCTVMAIAMTTMASAGHAQIDPRVLQQLQGQLGANQSDPGAQVDRARAGNAGSEEQALPGMTVEEMELRRAQSRIQIDALYMPSRIEDDYRERLGDPSLRQFGYDLFRAGGSSPGPVTGEVGDAYILGPGDELVVTFQGATNQSQSARVARDGRLIVGTLPPIRASGRSLGTVRTALAAATRENLLGTEVYISLGGVRSATVFVGGEVERPGQYQVSALSDIANVLAQAGGIRKSGSLRNVRIERRGAATRSVDLYGILGIGSAPSVGIQDGDKVIVPVVGASVAITGAVARPAIYELRGPATVGELIGYAGGALRPRGYEISISRIGEDGREVYIRSQGPGSAIIPGDALQIVGGSVGAAFDRVMLLGNVANPGPRALSSTPTVADLIGSAEELKLGTYLPLAVLVRRDTGTGMQNLEAFNLADALNGRRPVQLRSDDRVFVFSSRDIAFQNSSYVRRIILGENDPAQQCASLRQLKILVDDTQSSRFNILTRGTFTVERGGREVTASAGTSIALGSSGETISNISQSGNDQHIACAEIFEYEPALLPFLIENSIGVGGSVRMPGAYPVSGEVSAQFMIGAADGIVSNVGAVTLDVTSAATGEQSRYELPENDRDLAANLNLRAGDDIRVNSIAPAYESGAVLLTGAFRSPGLYSVRQGERLSALIARAGGLADNAYPYGAVFTRRSVRDAQQEGFKRTARELNTSLLALAGRKETSGEAIVAAGQLISTLSTTEAVGRMVVEADPRVLAARPDLDPILEGGDAIHMPKMPTYVLALGDVSNPGAFQFIPEKSVGEYLGDAGGTQSTADDGRIFMVLPNGSAQPVRSSFWRNSNVVVPPGSTLIVPKNLDPLRSLGIIRDVATIFGQVATAIASVAILADRRN